MTGEEVVVRDALAEVGLRVSSIWDLVNTSRTYRSAIPTLLDLLGRVSDPALKEGIVRALTVKEARGIAGPALIAEMKRWADQSHSGTSSLGWALGNALSEVVTPDDGIFDELTSVLRCSAAGHARQMVAIALAKTKHPLAVPELVVCLADPEVTAHALRALGLIGSSDAAPAVRQYIDDPRPLVRREARKALARCERAVV
jgi:HEAT repeat protein